MVEYCESFKMTFSKILAFLRRLKRFQKVIVMTSKVETAIGCHTILEKDFYPIINLADTL